MPTYKQSVLITGTLGLLAAILVGTGEFLLHFDTLDRFSTENYYFMLEGSNARQTIGHFFGVLGAPLYIVGCWHIYLMLKPANRKLAFLAFVIGAYGFMLGANWISSRASIGALMHAQESGLMVTDLVELYKLRYESLLSIIRITTLILSGIFIYLVMTSRSHYQKWQAILNPITLLLLSFVIYLISPQVGKYFMPIALNIAFGIFFIMSLIQARNIPEQTINYEKEN